MLEGAEGREGEMSHESVKKAGPATSVVASSFVEQYYKVLAINPSSIHRFYNEDSVFTRLDYDANASDVESTCVGQIVRAITIAIATVLHV